MRYHQAQMPAEPHEGVIISLKEADSITVDPHKAGYIPQLAGSLCYRDGRMRFLVTWTSPYLTQGSMENIDVYGVEGSKPGAAAMAVWLSNQTIGLDPKGYGMLLGEAAFTSARVGFLPVYITIRFLTLIAISLLRSHASKLNYGGGHTLLYHRSLKQTPDRERRIRHLVERSRRTT